jgi:spoIIIJ-associated protein
MLSPKDLKIIKNEVLEFFKKMDFEVEVEILNQKDNTLPIKLTTKDPRILIGERGQTLAEIQHLLMALLKKKINKEPFYINLDINDYKEKKIAHLKEMAREIAEEVVRTQKEKNLAPMPAFERRIIHLELADRQDVTTESIGKEPKRRVVIRPYP